MLNAGSIDLLIPCYNEEECISTLVAELRETIDELHRSLDRQLQIGILLVNDGSSDRTEEVSEKVLAQVNCFSRKVIISLSRNFGKEAALLAGMRACQGDACIILDADLQDPPRLIQEMIHLWLKGYQVVNAVRSDRTSDGRSKRITASGFYSMFKRFSHLDIQFNASDFRLLDRVAINAILACKERIRFSKGFFAWVGFKQGTVYYERPTRRGGTTKWGSWRLWNYALDGIFGFSTAPLRIWSYIGLSVTLISFVLGITAVIRTLILGIDVPGYASLFTAVTFLGGLQLIGIGILGEYIGRTYIEVKRRPSYIVGKVTEIP